MLKSIIVKQLVTICSDPYEAAAQAHAIIICTEWDEFTVITLGVLWLNDAYAITDGHEGSNFQVDVYPQNE